MAETELTVKETRHCVDILTDCSAKQHSQLEKEGQRACPQLGFPDPGWMAEKAELETSRAACRVELDKMPDFTTEGNQLRFSRAFVALPAAESYCDAPKEVVDAARSLLDADLVDTVAKAVHDAVTITIGANVLPLFRLVSGGRGRTLFVFRCVYDGCSSFLEARRFWGLTD